MGSLYPTPGIYSKYWSVDQEPLVELVQDTCGRHDTFGLACTARYYEDLGYPGHVNCSDNMNRPIWPSSMCARAAVGLRSTSFSTRCWTRPTPSAWTTPGRGRVTSCCCARLSDLVCVSTACPCDVDPANGWNPTDIQVRTYKAGEDFQRSIGYRKSAEADVEETKKTAFHDCFARHTQDFVEYNGYWLPNTFPKHGRLRNIGPCAKRRRSWICRPCAKYEVTGPDAEELMQVCVTRNVKKICRRAGQLYRHVL